MGLKCTLDNSTWPWFRINPSLLRANNFKLPCSLTRNITWHSMNNLAFHSSFRWKMIILPILSTSRIHSLFGRLGLFELRSERVNLCLMSIKTHWSNLWNTLVIVLLNWPWLYGEKTAVFRNGLWTGKHRGDLRLCRSQKLKDSPCSQREGFVMQLLLKGTLMDSPPCKLRTPGIGSLPSPLETTTSLADSRSRNWPFPLTFHRWSSVQGYGTEEFHRSLSLV